MEYDNKTILILGLVIIAIIGMIYNINELPLAVASGLVGYLSKDANITINKQTEDETDDI